MKKINYIILLLTIFSLLVSAGSTGKLSPKKIRKKILTHYKSYALYGIGETLNLRKLKIKPVWFRFLKKMYVILDYNRYELRKMLYGVSDKFIFPITNLETYNNYIRTKAILIYRSTVMSYFKNFLYLQRFFSKNLVYTNINKEKLIKKYGRYNAESFRKRLENYFLNEPKIYKLRNTDTFFVSFPTFTVIGKTMYYRLRTTKAIISKSGVIKKIWGEKSLYFIYNGELATLPRWQYNYFEKTIY